MGITLIISGIHRQRVHLFWQPCGERIQDFRPFVHCPALNFGSRAAVGFQTAGTEMILVINQDILHIQIGHHIGFPARAAHGPEGLVNIIAQVIRNHIVKRHHAPRMDITGHIKIAFI